MPFRRRIALATIALAGCSAADGAPSARVTVDTLPSGALSIMSPGPTAWRDSAQAWRVVEDLRIEGAEGSPGELADPQSIAVDDAGRLYVADQSPTVVKVFGPDGRFIRTIGHEGAGPGEFGTAIVAVHGDRLVVHDPTSTARTSVFDTSGTFIRSWASSCCYWAPIGIDRAALIYVPVIGRGDTTAVITYARYTMEGTLRDSVRVPVLKPSQRWVVRQGKIARMSVQIPYTPQMRFTLDPAGGVLYGWSGDYRLVRSLTGRDTAQLFGREWTPEPVPEETRRANVEKMISANKQNIDETLLRNSFPVGEVPSTAPAFSSLSADADGNRWVRTVADSGRTVYDVFDGTGAFLGPVTVPAALSAWGAIACGKGTMYAAVQNDEGMPAIVRYRIDKGTRAR